MDITTEVSILSSYVASPRIGHFKELLRIFTYLKIYHNPRVFFYPSYPILDKCFNKGKDWSDFYRDSKEKWLSNTHVPRGKEFITRGYVDPPLGDCKLTRKSRIGFNLPEFITNLIWLKKNKVHVKLISSAVNS